MSTGSTEIGAIDGASAAAAHAIPITAGQRELVSRYGQKLSRMGRGSMPPSGDLLFWQALGATMVALSSMLETQPEPVPAVPPPPMTPVKAKSKGRK